MEIMKQKIKSMQLSVILLATLAFLPSMATAQCPVISNQLFCDVRVQVDVYSYVTPNVCGTVPCSSYFAFIPAGAMLPVNCGACNVCNVRVTVNNIGGVNVGGVAADYSTVPPGNPIPLSPAPCNPPGGADIYYIFSTFKIQ